MVHEYMGNMLENLCQEEVELLSRLVVELLSCLIVTI